jgi:diaminopimelate decarboxylase
MNREDELFRINDTAFYTFDIRILKERIEYLKTALPKDVSLCYAVKANPFIVREIECDVDGFEVCSPGEAEICETLEIPSRKMVISGVYKTPSFIEKLIADPDFNGTFTVESPIQYRMLCDLSLQYGRKISILLRLTNDSQFGMNELDIESILLSRDRYPLVNHAGIQYFSGTQKSSVKKFRREIEHLDEWLISLRDQYGYTAGCLEYGPGFPVSYFTEDEFDEAGYFCEFSKTLEDMSCGTKIVLEIGRGIAAHCGRYYTHIVDIKQNKGRNYVLVDGGMHHIVYFGQSMAIKQPKLSVVGKPCAETETQWMICGSLCSMNDIIAKQVPLPDVEIGDIICFENTGAYCMTEGISLFLTREIPAVYLIRENGEAVCVRQAYETSQLNLPKYGREQS